MDTLAQLGLDEVEGLGSVLVHVLLVAVGVVAVAAVRVRRVAVGLDDAGVRGRAPEAAGASSKLGRNTLAGRRDGREIRLWRDRETYTASAAGTDVVGQAGGVVGVAHEDGGLDGVQGVAAQGLAGSAAEGVVHDLAALGVAD